MARKAIRYTKLTSIGHIGDAGAYFRRCQAQAFDDSGTTYFATDEFEQDQYKCSHCQDQGQRDHRPCSTQKLVVGFNNLVRITNICRRDVVGEIPSKQSKGTFTACVCGVFEKLTFVGSEGLSDNLRIEKVEIMNMSMRDVPLASLATRRLRQVDDKVALFFTQQYRRTPPAVATSASRVPKFPMVSQQPILFNLYGRFLDLFTVF